MFLFGKNKNVAFLTVCFEKRELQGVHNAAKLRIPKWE